MNTINNLANSSNWSVQVDNQNPQTQPKVHHHHHHKSNSQDSVQISSDGKTELDGSRKSPLDSLVADGTITSDQEASIKNAFMTARQANQAGTYGSKPVSPLSSLVANGTITQSQADSITSAFKARAQSNEGKIQSTDSQGTQKIHHHHHHSIQQTQDSTESNQATLQTSKNPNLVVNNILSASETPDQPNQDEENAI